jgi:hypothetical protein
MKPIQRFPSIDIVVLFSNLAEIVHVNQQILLDVESVGRGERSDGIGGVFLSHVLFSNFSSLIILSVILVIVGILLKLLIICNPIVLLTILSISFSRHYFVLQ